MCARTRKEKETKKRRQTISITDTMEVSFKIIFMLPIFNGYIIHVCVHQMLTGTRHQELDRC